MTWIENIILYWKEVAILASPLIGWFLGRKSRATKDKTDEVNLASTVIDVYKKMFTDLSNRIDGLERSNEDLTHKYGEMLLRNAILEERAETYESKYKTLEKDYTKLKSDHDKLHKENREIRKELEEIKNGNI
jgi:SMC interacting uncharacterized protein involved in chromosome segregation|nr:MAG TPA: Homeobox associated leucine zipper [Caudoviricetes sp.]